MPDSSQAGSSSTKDSSYDEWLVRKYEAEAGPVGPRKWFSATKFTIFARIGETFDDNILLSRNGTKRSDLITDLVAGGRLSFGDFANRERTFAVLGYTGSAELFARHGDEDCYNQDAIFDVKYRLHEFSIASMSTFLELHDATADLGQRVGRQIYGEDLMVKYVRNELTTFSSEFLFQQSNYDTSIDSLNLSLELAVDYAATSKVTLGFGLVGGSLAASDGLQEYFEQANLRASYALTGKVLLTASIGAEYRERGDVAGDSITPVFAVVGKWTPYTGTSVVLDIHRRTEASGSLPGEDFLDTGVQLGLQQTLLQRCYARVDFGYQNADYNQTGNGPGTARSDNFVTLRGAFGYDYVDWLKAQVFYERRQNDSTRSTYTFTSNRGGMELSLLY